MKIKHDNPLKLSVGLCLLFVLTACGGGSGSGDNGNDDNTTVNSAPVAQAGADQEVEEQTDVTLSGSGSDSDGTIVSYSWAQTAGMSVTLTSADSATASFSAPDIDADETLTFELTVTDDDGATNTDSVSINVTASTIFNLPDPILENGDSSLYAPENMGHIKNAQGVLLQGDNEDAFLFYVAENSTYEITIVHDSGDIDLGLFESASSHLLGYSRKRTSPEIGVFNLEPQKLYMLVLFQNDSGGDIDYSITIERTSENDTSRDITDINFMPAHYKMGGFKGPKNTGEEPYFNFFTDVNYNSYFVDENGDLYRKRLTENAQVEEYEFPWTLEEFCGETQTQKYISAHIRELAQSYDPETGEFLVLMDCVDNYQWVVVDVFNSTIRHRLSTKGLGITFPFSVGDFVDGTVVLIHSEHEVDSDESLSSVLTYSLAEPRQYNLYTSPAPFKDYYNRSYANTMESIGVLLGSRVFSDGFSMTESRIYNVGGGNRIYDSFNFLEVFNSDYSEHYNIYVDGLNAYLKQRLSIDNSEYRLRVVTKVSNQSVGLLFSDAHHESYDNTVVNIDGVGEVNPHTMKAQAKMLEMPVSMLAELEKFSHEFSEIDYQITQFPTENPISGVIGAANCDSAWKGNPDDIQVAMTCNTACVYKAAGSQEGVSASCQIIEGYGASSSCSACP
ncbi:MAG: hypothetical protein HWE10_13180 [Gammaproteobacteria bacterium]|nr:hypothetical protein [Gammaproteobacteria bacterium]